MSEGCNPTNNIAFLWLFIKFYQHVTFNETNRKALKHEMKFKEISGIVARSGAAIP